MATEVTETKKWGQGRKSLWFKFLVTFPLISVVGVLLIFIFNWAGNQAFLNSLPPEVRTTGREALLQGQFLKILVTGLAAFALTLFASLWFGRYIGKGLKEIAEVAEKSTWGDLTCRISFRAENEVGLVGWHVNRMVKAMGGTMFKILNIFSSLTRVVADLRHLAERISQSISQINNVTQQVANNSQQQSRLVEEAAATIEEMSAGLQEVAASAQVMNTSAQKAAETSTGGQQAVEKANVKMQAIQGNVSSLVTSFQELAAQLRKINEIVGIITGIADQTNLLALNAAIEAARAGEQGRGFAVVAEEVRKLAEQSAKSADDIGELITTIQQKTEGFIQLVGQSKESVASGAEAVNEAGNAFAQITHLIQEIADQSQSVSAAIEEMSAGSQQMVASVENISRGARENAAASQQVAASAAEQGTALEEIVNSVQLLTDLASQTEGLLKLFKVSQAQFTKEEEGEKELKEEIAGAA